MKKIKLCLLNVLLFTPFLVMAQEAERRLYKDAASMGMGGVGVSTMGYSFSVIRNPANLGLMSDHDIAPFISLGVSLNPDMINLIKEASAVGQGKKDFTQIDYDGLLGKVPNIGINGPLSAGYMGKGFGFWTTSSSDISMSVRHNPTNMFAQTKIGINALARMSKEYLDLKNPTLYDIQKVVAKHVGKNLKELGYSAHDIEKTIIHIAENIQKNGEDFVKSLLPEARVAATIEMTANVGYGYKIAFAALDDVSGLSLGATVRFSQRFKMISGDFQPIDQLTGLFSSIKENVYQGGSISSDFGASLRIQNWIFGFAVRDAFSTGYKWKNISGVGSLISDSKIPYSVDFGTSYRFFFTNPFLQEVGLYLEFEDSSNPYITWANKLRLGLETKLFHFLDLRVGMYDSFLTGGVGMGWKWGRIDFAYYRENYFQIFKSDQFYLNFTVGLDNSPARKKKSEMRAQQRLERKAQANELIEDSLNGI